MHVPSKHDRFTQARILIVDDEKGNINILQRMLRTVGYQNILSTTEGQKVTEIYRSFHPDLILLDIKMPGYSGFDVMRALRKIELNDYLPILVLTAQYDQETRLRALEAGAKDFINKPFEMTEILARIHNLLEVRILHNSVRDQNRTLEEQVQGRTAELQKSRMEVIHRLARAAEFRDNETGMHVIRMSKFSERLAREAGIDEYQRKLLVHACPLHDVGKIGIPDYILLKPGPLSPEEWHIMKTHTDIGAMLLSGSDSEMIQMAEQIAACHHEHWDGTGYPRGLRGEEIPLMARIVTVCDVFDALTNERPYKKAWPLQAAMEEIRQMRGYLFDPRLVDMFENILPDILDIAREFSDTEEDLEKLRMFHHHWESAQTIQKTG